MAVIATAEVRVIADTARFLSNLRRQLRGAFGKVGSQSAQQFTREFREGLGEDLTSTLRRTTRRIAPDMRKSGRNAATSFTGGWSDAVNRLSTDALAALRTQNLLKGASQYGWQTADAFLGSMRQNLQDRLGNEMREALLAPRNPIPPIFRKAGSDSAKAFSKGLKETSAPSAFVNDFLSGIDRRQGKLRLRMRRAGLDAFLSFRGGIQRAQDQIQRDGEEAAERLLRGFHRQLGSRSTRIGLQFGEQFQSSLTKQADRSGRSFARTFTKAMRKGLSNLRPTFGLEWNAAAIALVAGIISAASGALLALPAAANLAGAAVATLVVATRGMGDAFSAAWDDIDAFNDAIEDLAPAAQGVAREFRAIAPALSRLRFDVQQAFFAELDGAITRVASNLGGPFRTGMIRAGAALGRVADAIADFLSEAATARTVTRVFRTLESVFDDLAGAADPFLDGLRELTDAILPSLSAQTRPITRAARAFRDWATRLRESGEAARRFQDATGFLSNLANIASVAAEAMSVLGSAVGAFADTSRPFFEALGEAISTLDRPFYDLGAALGELLSALSPLLEPLASLVGLAAELVALLAELLTPVIEPLAELISAVLTPAIEALRSGIGFLRDLFQAWLEVMHRVWDWMAEQLIPILQERLWPIVRDQLIPALLDLWDAFMELVGALGDLQAEAASLIGYLIGEVFGEFDLWELVIIGVRIAIELTIFQMQIMISIIRFVIDQLRPLIQALQRVTDALKTLRDNFGLVKDAMSAFWDGIGDMVGTGGRVLNMLGRIAGAARDAAGAISSIPTPSLGGVGGLLGRFFADGGIVYGPTRAVIGEAGPEVVIPLTRPSRAMQLAEQSGLTSLLARTGADADAGPAIGEVHMHMNAAAADPEQVARRAIRQLRRELEGRGIDRVERRWQ